MKMLCVLQKQEVLNNGDSMCVTTATRSAKRQEILCALQQQQEVLNDKRFYVCYNSNKKC